MCCDVVVTYMWLVTYFFSAMERNSARFFWSFGFVSHDDYHTSRMECIKRVRNRQKLEIHSFDNVSLVWRSLLFLSVLSQARIDQEWNRWFHDYDSQTKQTTD